MCEPIRDENRVWEWDWLEGSIKKGVKQSSVKHDGEVTRKNGDL